MERFFLAFGASAGFLAVTAGAFGAHALRGKLAPADLDIFETAVRYQMYHSLALVVVALLASRGAGFPVHLSGWMFGAGIIIFSGSLYVLVLTGTRWLGAITPIGGVCFLIGWACLVWAATSTFNKT